MQNNVVRTVLTALFLVVLCFVVGVQAAENAKLCVGIVVGIVGAVFLLWMGPRSWMLIYLLPPVMAFFPLPGHLGQLPVAYVVCSGILCYWLLMWLMGYVKFKWRSLLAMDLIILLIFVYMVISFVRNPVSIGALGLEAEMIGGKEYVWCIVATLYYIAVSCVPATYEQLSKVLRWTVYLMVFICVLNLSLVVLGIRGGMSVSDLTEKAQNSRFSLLAPLGTFCIYIIYGLTPLSRILVSPVRLIGLLLSFCCIVISGWREMLMTSCFVIAAIAFIKRELWALTVLGILGYGGILFLSSEGIVKEAPFGMQRTLSMLPGVEIKQEIRSGAEHSSEWRKEMWSWALDPRMGYIHDYVWGDGFGQSVDYLERLNVATMRGTLQGDDRDGYARTGMWHSGYITSIHRLGYVGCAIIMITFLYGVVMMFRTAMAYRGTNMFLPALFLIVPYAGQPAYFFISAGTIPKFFDTYVFLATIKIFYCVGREKGIILPWGAQQRYVPQVIREHGEELQQS